MVGENRLGRPGLSPLLCPKNVMPGVLGANFSLAPRRLSLVACGATSKALRPHVWMNPSSLHAPGAVVDVLRRVNTATADGCTVCFAVAPTITTPSNKKREKNNNCLVALSFEVLGETTTIICLQPDGHH